MNQLLLPEEEQAAAKQGWCLPLIYDQMTRRWVLCVLPVVFTEAQGAPQAMNFVLGQARNNDQLSIKALRLLSTFNAAKGKK